jgi:hypothetical protein
MADRFGLGYDVADDAAAAALMALARQPRASEQEYMGMIVQDPSTGKFYRTGFQTDGSRTSSSWTGIPYGAPAGVVHNHPAARTGNRYPSTHFSMPDVDTARGMGVPSYITTPQQGAPITAQRKYAPDRKTQAVAPQAGEEFLAQFPIEEFLQQIALTSPMMRAYLASKRQTANPLTAALNTNPK